MPQGTRHTEKNEGQGATHDPSYSNEYKQHQTHMGKKDKTTRLALKIAEELGTEQPTESKTTNSAYIADALGSGLDVRVSDHLTRPKAGEAQIILNNDGTVSAVLGLYILTVSRRDIITTLKAWAFARMTQSKDAADGIINGLKEELAQAKEEARPMRGLTPAQKRDVETYIAKKFKTEGATKKP